MRMGLFGGTFNPIHIGHIKMAEASRKEYKLNVIYFIPCGIPPHKQKKDLLPAKLRCELVRKAIRGKKYLKVLDIEIKKKKPCYTIETIKRLCVETCRGKSLHFLIGQDEFEKLHTWKKPNELAKIVIFLVLPRGKRKKLKLPRVKSLKWHMVHTEPVDVSATEIRSKSKL